MYLVNFFQGNHIHQIIPTTGSYKHIYRGSEYSHRLALVHTNHRLTLVHTNNYQHIQCFHANYQVIYTHIHSDTYKRRTNYQALQTMTIKSTPSSHFVVRGPLLGVALLHHFSYLLVDCVVQLGEPPTTTKNLLIHDASIPSQIAKKPSQDLRQYRFIFTCSFTCYIQSCCRFSVYVICKQKIS